MVRIFLQLLCAPCDSLTPSPFPLLSPKAMETNTEAVGYLPVPFFVTPQKNCFPDFASPPISCLPFFFPFLFFYYNSTTFGCTGQGIGPIAVHRTVSIASRIDTRRRGRAGAIGYVACSTSFPPPLPPFVVSFSRSDFFLFNCWCHATIIPPFTVDHI